MKNEYSYVEWIEKENQQVDSLLSSSSTIRQFVISTRGDCTKIERKHLQLASVLEEGELGEAIDKLEEFHKQVHLLQSRTQKLLWYLSDVIEEIV